MLIIVNSGCIEPIHSFQIRIFGGIADTNDGIGLYILGQFQKFCESGLSAKLRMDFHFAIAAIIAFPAIPSSEWHTDMYSHRWGFRQYH